MSRETAIWVSQLLKRYARVVQNTDQPSSAMLHSLNTLQLADAVMDKAHLSQSDSDHALQIAIIGPTQSGKSTLVNVLLNADVAGISALAGFTVHAQGYATGCSNEQLDSLHPLMQPLIRTPADVLDAQNLNTYVLEPVQAGKQALVTPAVIWDTPDFDSIDASTYTHAVLNTVALADIVILMVSKDKYGDKSVWDMLSLIHPLQKPLLVCINKLDSQDEAAVTNAFVARFSDYFGEAVLPPITLFPFVRKTPNSSVPPFSSELLNALTDTLEGAKQRIDRQTHAVSASNFIETYRSQWLKPLIDEQLFRSEWQALVDQATRKALDVYTEDYLNNADKYDTFNRALAELLTLLEIPGLAATLARTRQLVTWPARTLLGMGRTAVDGQLDRPDKSADEEAEALKRSLDCALITIQGELLNQPQSPFWISLNHSFREHETHIRELFNQQSDVARAQFAPQIDAAAQQLYEQLQSQPALLNSLRAARVTTDAAGVALALKSGGLAPADLVLAPAMLSLTTLLTESALGRYLDTIKRDLKQRQREHIEQKVMQHVLSTELGALAETLSQDRLFSQQLEPELATVVATELAA